MRVVAIGTEEVALVPVPITAPAAVHSSSPVPVFLPMTLSTEPIGFLEGNRIPAGQVELIPVLGIVAVQTPPVFLVMLKHDFGMEARQLPSFGVYREHPMAVGTGVNPR